jgi:putative ABC transport system permease protein
MYPSALDWLLEALRSARSHGLRFGLAALGVGWGSAMLTMLMAYTDGYDRHFARQLEKVGPRIVWTFPGIEVKDRIGERGARPIELEATDASHIRGFRSVEGAAAQVAAGLRVHRQARISKLIWVYGVAPDAGTVRGLELERGRFIGPRDMDSGARVAVLGHEAAARIFGRRSALNRVVHIDGTPFRVIGVARRKGDQIVNIGPRDDELSLIPLTTAQRVFALGERADSIVFAPRRKDENEQAKQRVRGLLSARHGFDPDDDRAIGFFDVREAARLIDALGIAIQVFFSAAGGITLLVGAVGVVNTMLVVVGERTREIGLRKAVGAPSSAIFLQFLLETALVTGLSGAGGAALGALAVRLSIRWIPQDHALIVIPHLEPGTAAAMAGFLIAVGLVSGVLPARQAAAVSPAISMRSLQ